MGDLVGQYGGFKEVYVSTPLEVCDARDRKGLYAKARAGLIKEFTGVSDPYELPVNSEGVVDTSKVSTEEAVQQILSHLTERGFVEAA